MWVAKADWATLHETGQGPDAPTAAVLEASRAAVDASSWRAEADRYHLSLYGDHDYEGWSGYGGLYGGATPAERARLGVAENVVREVVDTVHARLIRHKPAPRVLTERGNWELQQQARALDHWIRGAFRECDFYHSVAHTVALQALIVGTSAATVVRDAGGPRIEVAPPWEMWVDPVEARYGSPRSLYRLRHVDRRQLMALFPDYAAEIETVQPSDGSDNSTPWHRVAQTRADLVRVVEAWRLPSGHETGDGRYVCAIETCTLANEEYARASFPFAFLRAYQRPVGFWGSGFAELLASSQEDLAITEVARQDALRLLSAPMMLIERGSEVSPSAETNVVGRVVEYSGAPPQVVAPSPVSPALTQHAQEARARMLAMSGISDMAVQALKPAGIDSGKALRTYHDMQSERLMALWQRYEQWVVDVARLLIDDAREAAESGEGTAVTHVGDGYTSRVDWRDINLGPDDYALLVQPASSMSQTLGGKLADLNDLRELGLLTDPSTMLELLGMPDLESADSLALAPRNLIMRVLTEILDTGTPREPEPEWDLQLAHNLGSRVLLQAQLDGAPEDRLDALRTFVGQCVAALQPPEPDMAQQPGGMPPAQPPGLPVAGADIGPGPATAG